MESCSFLDTDRGIVTSPYGQTPQSLMSAFLAARANVSGIAIADLGAYDRTAGAPAHCRRAHSTPGWLLRIAETVSLRNTAR